MSHLAKYPLTPEQAWPSNWPKPGEIYECGRVDTPAEWKRKEAIKMYGKPSIPGLKGPVIVGGVGGDFDPDEFKRLWNSGTIVWNQTPRNYGTIHRNSWKNYSNRSEWIDMGASTSTKLAQFQKKQWHNVEDEEVLLIVGK